MYVQFVGLYFNFSISTYICTYMYCKLLLQVRTSGYYWHLRACLRGIGFQYIRMYTVSIKVSLLKAQSFTHVTQEPPGGCKSVRQCL